MAARQTRRQLQFTGFEMTLLGVSFVVSMTAVFFLGLFVGKKNASYHAPSETGVARIPVDDFARFRKPAAAAEAVAREKGAEAAAKKAAAPAAKPADPVKTAAVEKAREKAKPAEAARNPAEVAAAGKDDKDDQGDKEEAESPARGGYTVQLLATRRQADAESLVAKLQGRGYNAYVKKISDGAGAWYRVRVGSFGAFGEARKMADRCRKELGLGQAFVSTE